VDLGNLLTAGIVIAMLVMFARTRRRHPFQF